MDKLIPFLSTKNRKIIDTNNKNIFLRGVNLGGWLMMEGYTLYGRNISESVFKRGMAENYSKKEVDVFVDTFRNSFIAEDDFRRISNIGLNCVRMPFNFRLIEDDKRPFRYNESSISMLEKVLTWCERYNIYCILDMHAACGSQNSEWHSDSNGKAYLWNKKICQKRFFNLWQFLADKFKDRSIIAGYDILNEPVIREPLNKSFRNFCKETVRHIRKIDKKHIIFLEGNLWARVLEDIGEPFSENICYSIHYYDPVDFTHNFCKGLRYPGSINGERWDRERIDRDLKAYHKLGRKWNVPIFLGEFGINFRCGKCDGELTWLKDVLELCEEYKFHWTYWTYKTIANSIFPSGLFQYLLNPPWINRMGPVYGWENYYALWKEHKKDIIKSWNTEYFTENKPIINLLLQR